MSKYIECEAAIEIAMQYCPDDDGVCSKADADLREMLDEIYAIPAADVVPVRHGRWVHPVPGDGEPYCSACHAEAEYFYGYGSFEPDFCPNCGALMDKDGDGERDTQRSATARTLSL